MSDTLILYTNPISRGRIARWMLEEIGAPYRTEVVEFGPLNESIHKIDEHVRIADLEPLSLIYERAVRAYEKLGFTDTGVRLPHPTVRVLTELQMRRRV